jgi:hypothetical protein
MSEQAAVAAAPKRSATRRAVSNHPNASVALGSGAGIGPIVIWLIGMAHVQMTPEVGGAVGGLVAAGFLLVGRRGIKNVIIGLWEGPER